MIVVTGAHYDRRSTPDLRAFLVDALERALLDDAETLGELGFFGSGLCSPIAVVAISSVFIVAATVSLVLIGTLLERLRISEPVQCRLCAAAPQTNRSNS